MDLISCRNLLIYLSREIQEKAIALFHYALRPQGFLCLGSSETADAVPSLFRVVDKKERVYQRQESETTTPRFSGMPLQMNQQNFANGPATKGQGAGFVELYQQWRLRRYAPPALLVNEQYDIVHIFGNAGRYFQLHEGPATLNVLQEALPVLRSELHTALYAAFHKDEHTTSGPLPVEIEGDWRMVCLHVGPVAEPGFPAHLVEVVFEELAATPAHFAGEVAMPERDNQVILRLGEELRRTKERLQTVIAEYETTHDELKASNEELQSMNEEVTTVNQTLKTKIEELSHANSDLQNLMASTAIGTVFLDRNLCIKRFTPSVQTLFHLLPGDVGRPLVHFAHQLRYGRLVEDARHVLAHATTIEKEIQSNSDHWHMMRLLPYRTLNDEIDGVVITFFEITELKETQQVLHASEMRFRNTFENAAVGMAHIDGDGAWLRVNQRLCKITGYTQSELQQHSSHTLTHEDDLARELPLFERLLRAESEGYQLEKRYRHKAGHFVWTNLTMTLQRSESGRPLYGIAVIEDISARKAAEERLRFLSESSTALAASLDYQVTLQQVANLMTPRLADWCAVDIIGPDGALSLAAVAHVDPAKAAWARELRQRYPPDMDAPQGLPNVIRTGRAEFYPEITEELILRSEPDDEQLAIIRQVGFKSVIIAPLSARGQVLGGLTLVWSDSDHRYSEADVRFAEEVARRAALAVDNARLYQEARSAELHLTEFNTVLAQRVAERTAELERSNRELDQFTYVASHDLKAPLRGIEHIARWIAADAHDILPPASQEHLAKLIGRIKRMEALLNDLLAYSHAGRQEHGREWVDTAALVSDINELVAPPQGFTLDVIGQLPVLHTERVPLETVFRNLIGNALKHHDNPTAGFVRIFAEDKGQCYEFTVCDNGPGIEPAYHERVFQMFQTLKPRDQVEGSGIGLTLVKKIVESRGGVIQLASNPGQGATFRFTWPKQ
jgi:two-component system CheB/CheR fusion protein